MTRAEGSATDVLDPPRRVRGPLRSRQLGWEVMVAATIVLVVLLATFAHLLGRSQQHARDDAEQRLRERAQVTAAVTEAVFANVAAQGAASARERFAGGVLSPGTLDAAVRRSRSVAYIRVVGGDGRTLAASTGAPPGSARPLPHVRAALRGRWSLSNVLRTPRGGHVIEWAVPYRAGAGSRVQVSALTGVAVAGFLAQTLTHVPAPGGTRAYVVDADARIVGTSSREWPGLRLRERALVDALAAEPAGSYGDDRYFVSARVGTSPWRVVMTTSRGSLYAPVSGVRGWLPWMIFAALALCALSTVLLLRRGVAAAWRLREANRDLAVTNAALRDAQTVGHIGSWEWDVAADRLTWSEELHRIYGVAPEDFDGRLESFLERIDPRDRAATRHVVARALEHGQPFSLEERIRRPDGEQRVLHSRGDVVLDGRGEVVRLIGVCQDVTDQRRAEAAAAEAEERFRNAFEHGSVGMALVGTSGGARGRLLHVNPSLCEITGRPPNELGGMSWSAIVHPDDAAAIDETLERLLAGTLRTGRLEQRFLRRDGALVWVEANASLARDAAGRPLYAILQVQDVNERKRFEGQLRYLADHDPLTGLLNRRGFKAELDRHVARALRYGATGAVLMVDLDHFKFVNDTLGHAAGDDLLRHVASSLRERLRETDVVSRLGGDEFAVILAQAGESEAMQVASDLSAAVREAAVVAARDGRARLTASVGVAMFGPGHALDAESALMNADIAMYSAKRGGRDRIEALAGAEIEQGRMKSHLAWAQAIRDAIAEDRFVVHAQPILDLGSGAVSRHELLLRMVADDGELVPPAAFLDVAEQCGLMQAIDCLVVRRAVRILRDAQADGRALSLQVNLSGSSVTDAGVLEVVQEEVSAAGIDARRLVFEITETTAIGNIDKAKRFAETVGALGCGIALDDFGAGFGSFYYLKHLPFDCLKIDGEFIRTLATSRSDQVTVHAMVEVAHGLGKTVIAEFVEDGETLEILRRYGADFAQGHHIGRPEPLAGARSAVPAAPTA